ncbi:MAG: SpoVA/SpoVAEb family sporulation membrane protein [Bacilli bacterium]|nr:SpoVA/SpoVAEb family sporulation membrane protein [Bacilli bacterium]
MEKKEYKKIVDRHKPTETRVQNAIISFLVGGLVGLIGQGLIDFYANWLEISTKDASTFMIVTLVFVASLFTALGFFDKWVTFARCGLIIPITGFAHSMTSAGIEYRKEGPIYGLGMNIFKLAGSVILYGIVAAWIFGTIRYLLLGGI